VPASPVKTRFAPSPTGRLHLGNARTALFNALYARHTGGLFLLRVEDTDAERSRPEFVEGLVEDLRWLGLDWQEGYLAGGEAGPYRQSERGALYRSLLERLQDLGLAYLCFCPAERLEALAAAQRGRREPPRYDGACARLSRQEADARLARGEPAALRFRVPPRRTVEFVDGVRGPQRFDTAHIGDFVIRRADGTAAFFFCNAVDDALMGVTDVLRAEDHLSNTPRQLLLLEALGLPAPRYAHLSLVVDASGAPLSKRAGDLSLAELRAVGYLPLALANYLARLGHHYRDDAVLDLDGLARQFDPGALGSAPARFDPPQLLHWQQVCLAGETEDRLWAWVGESVRGAVPAEHRQGFLQALRGTLRFPVDAARWAERLYGPPPPFEPPARDAVVAAGGPFFDAALEALARAPADFPAFARELRARTGRGGSALFKPLRAALTGVLEGPELARIVELCGYPRVQDRLARAARRAADEQHSTEDG
jgi:glutamyl-tRNA synthetase